jgi:hypothetical protein
MSRFAMYVHEQSPHVVIHKSDCGEVRKTGKGDVTEAGFWVECDSFEAAQRLRRALELAGYGPGSRNGDWYCMRCHPALTVER